MISIISVLALVLSIIALLVAFEHFSWQANHKSMHRKQNIIRSSKIRCTQSQIKHLQDWLRETNMQIPYLLERQKKETMKTRMISWECPVCNGDSIEVFHNNVSVIIPIAGLHHNSDDIEVDYYNIEVVHTDASETIYRCSSCGHVIVEGSEEAFIEYIADDVAMKPSEWRKQ